MEASGEVIRRLFRNQGRPDSYKDAGNYLSELFGESPRNEQYFAAFYEDRVKAVHPASRVGVFSDASLASDDFHDLHESLLQVYYALILNDWR